MAVQLYSAPINTNGNMLPERFERKFYLVPKEVGLAYGLLRLHFQHHQYSCIYYMNRRKAVVSAQTL
jgi:hypothetical protein